MQFALHIARSIAVWVVHPVCDSGIQSKTPLLHLRARLHRSRFSSPTRQPRGMLDDISSLQHDLGGAGFASTWDHVMLKTRLGLTSRFLVDVDWWDRQNLDIARSVIEDARTNFHHLPRKW